MKDVKDVKVVILWMVSIFFVPLLALTFLFLDHSVGLLYRIDWSISDWLEGPGRLTLNTRQMRLCTSHDSLPVMLDCRCVCFPSFPFTEKHQQWYTGTGRIASKAKEPRRMMSDGSGNAQSVPYLATIHSTRSLSRVLFPEVGFGLIDTFSSLGSG